MANRIFADDGETPYFYGPNEPEIPVSCTEYVALALVDEFIAQTRIALMDRPDEAFAAFGEVVAAFREKAAT